METSYDLAGDDWLVRAGNLRAGEGLYFNRQQQSEDDIRAALKAQFPNGEVQFAHRHGQTVYIRRVSQ